MGQRAYLIRESGALSRSERLGVEIQKVLELMATGASLDSVLEFLVLSIEAFSEGMLGSIELLAEDGKHLKTGAAPNLPDAYNRRVNGLEIGPRACSCGTAAFRGIPVFVSDIETDPLWEIGRDIARRFNLRACWSTPIFSHDREVLGTFAMYYKEVRSPDDWERELIERTTHVAAIAIEQERFRQGREKARRELELERQELQQALRERQELIATIDGIVWESDRNFRFVFVSKQSSRILGYSPEQWLSEPSFWADHLHPEDRGWAVKYCQERVSQCSDHQFVYRMIAADGRTVWVRDIVSVITEKGQVVRLRGVMIDVTEAKKAELALAEAHEELRRIAASVSDCLWSASVDSNGKWSYRYYSPVVLKITGRPEEFYIEDPGRWLSTVYETDRSRVKEAFERLLHRQSSFEEAEYRIALPDGSIRWVRDSATTAAQADGKTRINGVVSDVTARKQMEQTRELLLKREIESRIEAEKSVSLRDDFIAIASHELKTPLTPLKMHIQLLRRQLSSVTPTNPLNIPMFLRALDESDRELSRLARFIDDLLDVSRISAGRLVLGVAEVDLSKLVCETVLRYQAEFRGSGCELRLGIQPGIIGFWDSTRIEQVLVNLLTNAIKYGARKPVEISLTRSAEKAVLIVRDHGIGIAQEDIPRMFHRFERVAPIQQYAGLGLGLYISREIVTAHGGRIKVESERGKGAAFIVELPVGPITPIGEKNGEAPRKLPRTPPEGRR